MAATGVICSSFGVWVNNMTNPATTMTISNPGRSFKIVGFDVYDSNQPTADVTVRKNSGAGNIAARITTGVNGWNQGLLADQAPLTGTVADTEFSSTDDLYIEFVASGDINAILIRMVANPSQPLEIVQT